MAVDTRLASPRADHRLVKDDHDEGSREAAADAAFDGRIGTIFAAAADLPPDERSAFLDRACEGDERLRAAVASLLAHDGPDDLLAVESPEGLRRRRTHPLLRPGDARSGGVSSWFWSPLVLGLAGTLVSAGLAVGGAVGATRVQNELQRTLHAALQEEAQAAATEIREWLDGPAAEVARWAREAGVERCLGELAAQTRGRDVNARAILGMPPHQELLRILDPLWSQPWVEGVTAVSREDLVILFAPKATPIVNDRSYRLGAVGARTVAEAFVGKVVYFSPYYPGELLDRGPTARPFTQMVVGSPVTNSKGDIEAVLAVQFRSEPELTRRLHSVLVGPATDVYAFNGQGEMVSRSRHENAMKAVGVMPRDAASSVRTVELRDPGGDLAAGFRPAIPRHELPFTRMARTATTGAAGVDVDGYRDARGRLVVGAWQWLALYDMGVAVERDLEDAYARPARIRLVSRGLAGAAALPALFGLVSWASTWRRRRAVVKARRLGEYHLEEVIGEGGNAVIHRATHPRLPRPLAVKILKGGRRTADEAARFEREALMVNRLSHPNTIRILDYGETDQGELFCVMELAEGITFSRLVQVGGPVPIARALHLLTQVCLSLKEAHALGIVHRDIKPTNLMLCDRTDGTDIVKVLDFGLARLINGDGITLANVLAGTPVYIAPERIHDPARVDARADIYSMGGVMFYLLTGSEIIEGASPEEILIKALRTSVPHMSTLMAGSIPEELETLVTKCLSPDPEQRPQHIDEVLVALERLATQYPWNERDARAWWQASRSHFPELSVAGP